MLVLGSGRVYLERGERAPFVCPACEHIMDWFVADEYVTCRKCDHEADISEFEQYKWSIVRVN